MAVKVRSLIPLGVLLALAGLFAIGLAKDPRLIPSPLIEHPAPAFELPELRELERKVSHRDLQNKVSLFNVWASWCVACREEHPYLMELSRQGEVPIYGLNYKDERTDAITWLDRFGDPYVASAFDLDGRVGIDWGVYGVPETFVIDRKGIIRYKHIGVLRPEVLDETILPLVRKLQKEPG